MLEERPLIKDAIEKILFQNYFERYRNPNHYAGGKMVWRYSSVLGQKGNLEIDLNYMYRQPLWPVQWKSPKLDAGSDFIFPVLDVHEVAAGKLSALITRNASRDLYDTHYLLTKIELNSKKLRFAFVVYIGMTGLDPSLLTLERVQIDGQEFRNRLLPVLNQKIVPRTPSDIIRWSTILKEDLSRALNRILPLQKNEFEFISRVRRLGKIDASLLTDDLALQKVVENHPALLWATNQAGKEKH